MKTFNKILIANRGEIAVRVIKTARKMGVKTVAVYSEVDADSLHVSQADESFCIGKAELSETYLNIEKIIHTAKDTGCDAIHPGYGFLAENPLFVEACDKAGIVFIGPNARAMKMMGNKIEARAFAKKINVPITEGMTGTKEELMKVKNKVAFPVLLKAAAGGGGKGMRIVHDEKELEEAIESTSRQAKAYFKDATVYIEKYLEEPRHIEFQILADNFGNVIHLFERECSIQRRYQKIIEESPSPTLTPELRKRMGEAAVNIGKEIGYNNAGTIEFLVDKDLNFYFLEMNTRIQVEHPVTEMVTGIDIVEEQIYIAAGNELRLEQEELSQKGHSIECRIYAEDPAHDFMPSPGIMTLYKEPKIDHCRIDTGITLDTEIKSFFDPMICKLVTWGKDRKEATNLMIKALDNYIIHGITTNIPYLKHLLNNKAFITNSISTKFCDQYTLDIVSEIEADKQKTPAHIPIISFLVSSLYTNYDEGFGPGESNNIWKNIGYWRNHMSMKINFEGKDFTVAIPSYGNDYFEFDLEGNKYYTICKRSTDNRFDLTINDDIYTAYVSEDNFKNAFVSTEGHIFHLKRNDLLTGEITAATEDDTVDGEIHIKSPMPGKVIKVNVMEGEAVNKGALLLIIEAMKMENRIVAPREAIVSKINISLNDMVEARSALMILE
jgi:3-methylcrotonyl-CoA carboxylase alpha subunit